MEYNYTHSFMYYYLWLPLSYNSKAEELQQKLYGLQT